MPFLRPRFSTIKFKAHNLCNINTYQLMQCYGLDFPVNALGNDPAFGIFSEFTDQGCKLQLVIA